MCNFDFTIGVTVRREGTLGLIVFCRHAIVSRTNQDQADPRAIALAAETSTFWVKGHLSVLQLIPKVFSWGGSLIAEESSAA
jgi:hypothetical protein